MTTFNDPFIGLPTPSDHELAAMDAANARWNKLVPFVAVRHNRLLTIIGVTPEGLYRDTRGYLHFDRNLERDLDAYAERMRAEYQDQNDTHDDCQW